MTSFSFSRSSTNQPSWLKAFYQSSPLLAITTFIYLLLFVACLVLYVFDSRVVLGAPVWLKPMKFALSFAVYSATLAVLLQFVPRHGWRGVVAKLVSYVYVVTAIIEVGLISFQAARGVPSHFNQATEFDSLVFGLMGSMAAGIWFASFGLGVLLFFQKFSSKALAWGLRMGVITALFGMLLAMSMIATPSLEQQALLDQDLSPSSLGAHAVGVEDGGEGLAFLGWSTEGGDLRIAHFIGIHAMQILPLIALLILRFLPKLSNNRQLSLSLIASFAYFGVMLLTYWQALRGQSIMTPDALTLTAFFSLIVLTIMASMITLRTRSFFFKLASSA